MEEYTTPFVGADVVGVGWGLQAGADLTEVVMILNNDAAVKAFSRGGNVTIGGSISAAVGPIGAGGQIAGSLVNPAPIFSYSRSKGKSLFWFSPRFPMLSVASWSLRSTVNSSKSWRIACPWTVFLPSSICRGPPFD